MRAVSFFGGFFSSFNKFTKEQIRKGGQKRIKSLTKKQMVCIWPADFVFCEDFSRLQTCPLYMFGNKATDGTYGSKYWFPGFGFDSGPNLQPCFCSLDFFQSIRLIKMLDKSRFKFCVSWPTKTCMVPLVLMFLKQSGSQFHHIISYNILGFV